MHILSAALVVGATIISLIYGIQLLVLAFRTSVLWGLGYLFIPLVGLIFIIVHWENSKGPFLKSLIAIPLVIAAAVIAPAGLVH